MNHTLVEPDDIRQQRKELGLSQQRLAELSGLSLRTVVRLEHGENKRGGTTHSLSRILKALDAARDELNSTCYEDECCGQRNDLSTSEDECCGQRNDLSTSEAANV